jgi:hypothetical protein
LTFFPTSKIDPPIFATFFMTSKNGQPKLTIFLTSQISDPQNSPIFRPPKNF